MRLHGRVSRPGEYAQGLSKNTGVVRAASDKTLRLRPETKGA